VTAIIVPDYRDLVDELDRKRSGGRTVALANGCFDVLHVGHIHLLADARKEADILVVALNSDDSVRANKPGRPLMPLDDRMEIIAALEGVDYVTSFDEPTAGALLETLRPEVQIKGTDRTPESVPERDIVLGYGGRIAICGTPKTRSSSALIARLRRG
jgi:rfaE bifunctional protein nucleotidyltransferase chain/domain